MTFYDLFDKLCTEKKVSLARAAADMGFSNSTTTKWSKGSKPKSGSLVKIANYFNIELSYLVELVEGIDTKKAPTPEGERVVDAKMWEFVDAMQSADEATQTVVRRLLGLP